jgi:hypothetical protein
MTDPTKDQSREDTVHFAPKSDGGLQMYLDYRALNKVTGKDNIPTPRVNELIDRLQGRVTSLPWICGPATTRSRCDRRMSPILSS